MWCELSAEAELQLRSVPGSSMIDTVVIGGRQFELYNIGVLTAVLAALEGSADFGSSSALVATLPLGRSSSSASGYAPIALPLSPSAAALEWAESYNEYVMKVGSDLLGSYFYFYSCSFVHFH
jgi:hypothetical protein